MTRHYRGYEVECFANGFLCRKLQLIAKTWADALRLVDAKIEEIKGRLK